MRVFRAGSYLFSLGLRLDRRRLLRAVMLMVAGFIAAPLAALALRDLTNAVLARQASSALTYGVVTAILLVAQLMLSHFAHLDYFAIAELQQSRLRGELMNLVNGRPGIEHLDRPDFADTAGLVRDGLLGTTKALEAVLQLVGLLAQAAITAAILIDLKPCRPQALVRLPSALRGRSGDLRAQGPVRRRVGSRTNGRTAPPEQASHRGRHERRIGEGDPAVRCRARAGRPAAAQLERGHHGHVPRAAAGRCVSCVWPGLFRPRLRRRRGWRNSSAASWSADPTPS